MDTGPLNKKTDKMWAAADEVWAEFHKVMAEFERVSSDCGKAGSPGFKESVTDHENILLVKFSKRRFRTTWMLLWAVVKLLFTGKSELKIRANKS